MIEGRERDTILAALRVYQDWQAGTTPDGLMIEEIATNGGLHGQLDASEIDDLCERLNT